MSNPYELPDKINNFNVYDGKTKLIGVSAEVTLPPFEPLTDTLNVAGMAGEIESEVIGSFGSMKIEIPFENISEDFFVFAASTNPVILRGSMEIFNTKTQAKHTIPVVLTVKGRTLTIDPGVLKKGGKGQPKITKEITYIKVTMNNTTQVEIDKLNNICIMGGVDLLEKIRSQI